MRKTFSLYIIHAANRLLMESTTCWVEQTASRRAYIREQMLTLEELYKTMVEELIQSSKSNVDEDLQKKEADWRKKNRQGPEPTTTSSNVTNVMEGAARLIRACSVFPWLITLRDNPYHMVTFDMV